MSSALVIGAGGQDGRLLTEQLEAKDHRVIGVRRGDVELTDAAAVARLVCSAQADEIYYLAAHHHSSQDAVPSPAALFRASFAVHVDGLINVLEAMRLHTPSSKLFYAASSHVFGPATTPEQDESTALRPGNVYGITKAAGMHACRFYRETHGLFASVGILYNHESHYRRREFVSTKIVRGAVNISRGGEAKFVLGDLASRIDWGYAPDYVDAMIRILALNQPGDFVVATGEAHTVSEFARIAFAALGLDWRAHVEENPDIVTRAGLGLVGNPAKLKAATGWAPTVTFDEMIRRLLDDALLDGQARAGGG